MKNLLVFIFIFSTLPIFAQTYSKAEAKVIAQQFFEKKILSERGRDSLISRIEKEILYRELPLSLMNNSVSETNELNKTQLLYFLSRSFLFDIPIRSGFAKSESVLQEFLSKLIDNSDSLPDIQLMQYSYDSLLINDSGVLIENSIVPDDNYSDTITNNSFQDLFVNYSSDTGFINYERSVLGKTCLRTLQDLLEIKLIDSSIYSNTKQLLSKREFLYESQMLMYITGLYSLNDDKEYLKIDNIKFVEQLGQADLISQAKVKLLMDSITNYNKCFTKFELLNYCNNSIVLSINDISKNPINGYQYIFNKLKLIIPNFDYKELTIKKQLIKDSYEATLYEERLMISFNLLNDIFTHEFFYNFTNSTQENLQTNRNDTLFRISHEFHKGINKFLASTDSKYRLYFANKKEEGLGVYDGNQFGLILMTEEQYKAWGVSNSDYFIFSENHTNNFKLTRIKEVISDYERIGLFKHLSKKEISDSKKTVLSAEINNYVDILICFPKTITYFDWEASNLMNPYEELLTMLAKSTRGAFKPYSIKDNFGASNSSQKSEFSFVLDERKYSVDLEIQSDWLDPRFLDLINNAMLDSKIDGKFYYCMDGGQASGFIFLNASQYFFLKQAQPGLFLD